MSIWKRMTSQFYATFAGFFHGTDGVDSAIEEGVVARMEANNLIFRWPDGREEYHHIQVGARTRIGGQVNKWNETVREKQQGHS